MKGQILYAYASIGPDYQGEMCELAYTEELVPEVDGDHRRNTALLLNEFGMINFNFCTKLVQNKWFISIFMLMTFYALFAPDLDMLFGDKGSEEGLAMATSVVVVLFILELIVQCLGKENYFGRADDVKLVANIGLELDTNKEFYLFGNYAERKVLGGFFFRNPTNRGGIFSTNADGTHCTKAATGQEACRENHRSGC
jgi:hypothetical protein